jgi:hypothetical protein
MVKPQWIRTCFWDKIEAFLWDTPFMIYNFDFLLSEGVNKLYEKEMYPR